MTINVNNAAYEPEMSGFVLSQQDKQVKLMAKMPTKKADIVKGYSLLVKKRKLLQLNEQPLPQSLVDEIQVYDSLIYKTFSPQERKLIHQQALMDRS